MSQTTQYTTTSSDPSLYIPWNKLTPECLQSNVLEGIEKAQKNLDDIAHLPAHTLTFENTFLAFEHATQVLDEPWSQLNHLTQVADSPSIRDIFATLLPKVTLFYAQIPFYPNLWATLKAYSNQPDSNLLPPISKRLIQETLQFFEANGAQLSQDQQELLKNTEKELATLTQKYSENVLDSTNAWELIIKDQKKLQGLPPLLQELARQDALTKEHGTEEHPQYRFTLQAPSCIPFLQYVEDEALRKQVWEAASQVARTSAYDNHPLIQKILCLRQKKAELLGKPNFADYILQNRMAQSSEKATHFIEELHEKVKPFFEKEIENLQKTSPSPLEPWSIAYLSEQLRQKTLSFNEEELRPYFPLPSVLEGLFRICHALYGITITEYTPPLSSSFFPETWDPQVKVYTIFDQDGSFLGSFYTDLFPRSNKRSGAWMNAFKPKLPQEPSQKLSPGLGLICANFTPPSQDTPSLLTHTEVQTLFHELGHLLHYIFGAIPYPSLNGINVKWDFVELPSQIMENWCWEQESLNLFARHYQTGQPIPEELFQKLLTTRSFLEGIQSMRQLSLAKLDLALHIHPEKYLSDNIEKEIKHLLLPYTPPYNTFPPSIICRFTHIFGDSTGYASGYYSYKWAEVLEASAFTRFQKEGILSPPTGQAFRKNILSQGNSQDPLTLFKQFTGHDPDPNDLLKRLSN